ncbi:hypothetical protein EON80_25295, partial [bacterium]
DKTSVVLIKNVGRKFVFSPDNTRLTDAAAIYDARSGARLRGLIVPPTKMLVTSPSWSPDGTRIVTGFQSDSGATNRKGMAVWDASSGEMLWNKPYPEQDRKSELVVAFSQDGKQLSARTATCAVSILAPASRPVSFPPVFRRMVWLC